MPVALGMRQFMIQLCCCVNIPTRCIFFVSACDLFVFFCWICEYSDLPPVFRARCIHDPLPWSRCGHGRYCIQRCLSPTFVPPYHQQTCADIRTHTPMHTLAHPLIHPRIYSFFHSLHTAPHKGARICPSSPTCTSSPSIPNAAQCSTHFPFPFSRGVCVRGVFRALQPGGLQCAGRSHVHRLCHGGRG